jgi:hypothetical protein
MGDSRPPASMPVDLVNSYALRRGDRVEVSLAEPSAAMVAQGAVMVLRQDGRRIRSEASVVDDARGRRLVASFASGDLDDGQYRVVVRADDVRTKVGARLLVQGRRPVVLLWGDRPAAPRVEV